MAKWKLALGLFGLLLLVAVVLSMVAPKLIPAVPLASFEPAEGLAEIDSRYQAITAGPFIFDTIKIEIRYPARIRVNETLSIEARTTQFARFMRTKPAGPAAPQSTDPQDVEVFDKLAWPIRLELSGAGFDIDPRERDLPKGAPLPITARWTALSEGTGQHALVLDWAGTEPPASGWYPESEDTRLSVNGQPVDVQSNSVSLPVEVVTKWGWSQVVDDIIHGAISLIAFLCGLPLLGWLWKRYMGGGAAS